MSDIYDEKAAGIVRQVIAPLYPTDKPIAEMTDIEQGIFRLWVPIIAAALRLCRGAELEIAKLRAENEGLRTAFSTLHEGCIGPEDATRQREAAYIAGLEAAKEASQGCVHAIQCVVKIQGLIDAKKGQL